MAKWLVTGGSGFLGINLIRHLLKHGQQVVSLDKEPFEYEDVKDAITIVQGDVRDRNTVDHCMGMGIDVVMHGAAALPLYSKGEIMSTNVQGTRVVLESALAHKVMRTIYISSTAVYGVPDHHPLYEDDKMVGVGPYGHAKIQAEAICDEMRSKGMVVTTIRPKSFIGPERLGVFAIFYEWASEGRSFPMIGRGNNLYQLLDVEDLSEAIRLAGMLEDTEKVNTVFNIGAREYTTMKEDYQVVLDKAGFGKKVKGSPTHLVVLGLTILDKLKLSPLYPWVYKTASKDSFVSVKKAEALLGWVPKYSNKEALLRNYEWFLANRDSFDQSSGVSHRVPWKQGILGLVKYFF